MEEAVRASEIEHMPSIQKYQIGGMKDRLGRNGAGAAAAKPERERFHFADAGRLSHPRTATVRCRRRGLWRRRQAGNHPYFLLRSALTKERKTPHYCLQLS